MLIKSITIPRGNNIGKAIINNLKECKLYSKVNIVTFDIKRDVKNRTITASVTYKYKH